MTPPVLSVDPGLATTGWVLLREGQHPPTAAAALELLERWGTITTDSGDPLHVRLQAIHQELRSVLATLCAEQGRIRAVVELPATAFAYDRHGGRGAQRGVNVYLMAAGVCLAAVAGAPGGVVEYEAPAGRWAKKRNRHLYLQATAEGAGLELPSGPRGGEMPDVLDALWQGVQVVRTPPMDSAKAER